MTNENDLRSKVIAKAWKDPEFKKRLLQDPKSALKECGFEVPEHLNIKVIEDQENSYTFVLPKQPESGLNLSERELLLLAGGWFTEGCGITNTVCTPC